MSYLLLIEDSATVRVKVRGLLSGHELREAPTRAAARPLLGGAALIILDLSLPDGDGIDWLVELRPSVPVIVISIDDRARARFGSIAAGWDFLSKRMLGLDESGEPASTGAEATLTRLVSLRLRRRT